MCELKLFSPIILDQMENEPCYLEGPYQADSILNRNTTSQHTNFIEISNPMISSPMSSENSNSLNQKIIGNDFSDFSSFQFIQ